MLVREKKLFGKRYDFNAPLMSMKWLAPPKDELWLEQKRGCHPTRDSKRCVCVCCWSAGSICAISTEPTGSGAQPERIIDPSVHFNLIVLEMRFAQTSTCTRNLDGLIDW